MHRIAILAVPLLLAACASEPAEEAPAEEPMDAAPAMTAANGSPPGAYTVTAADGSTTTTVINADGTFVDTAADGSLLTEGTWAVVDGKTCFTPTTEGEEPMCYSETAPGADGSFTATPDEGEPVTVMPAAEEMAPAA